VASGAKAGTYNLVTESDAVPEFCLGGCVYTKESDSVPGSNYCFQAGQGEVSCSGGGCGGGGGGDVEGWIEKYFEKQCSTQFNSMLRVRWYKAWQRRQCGPRPYDPITNLTLQLFDNPTCEGKPLQKKLAKGYEEAFLIKVENTNSWSVRAAKEKYETVCQTIGPMMPFTSNYASIPLREVEEKAEIVRTASLNFSYDLSNDLQTSVFIQSNPYSCTNSSFGKSSFKVKSSRSGKRKKNKKKKNKKNKNKKKGKMSTIPKKKMPSSDYEFFKRNPARRNRQYGWSGCGGSGWGSGGSGSGGWGPGGCNWKCRPTCPYSVGDTEPSLMSCQCRGVVGTGLNDTYQGGSLSGLTGGYDWYDDPAIPPYWYPTKYFLVFSEITRRNNQDLPVCESKLSLTYNSPNKTQQITKDVPCFTRPVPPPTMLPTFPTGGGSGNPTTTAMSFSPPASEFATASPSSLSVTSSGLGSGSSLPWPTTYPQYLTTVNHHDMFNETDGVLIWGGSDRFWIVGCMEESSKDKFVTFDVEFFTSRWPSATPEFCGCILRTLQGEETMASKELVKDCYVNAIKGGAAPRTGGPAKRQKSKRKQRGKQTRRTSRKRFRRMRKQMENINFYQRPKRPKTSLREMINNMKRKDRHFISRSKRDVSDEKFGRELFDEEDLMEEEDISNDQDYEERSSYEMMNDENDYDYYDDDFNLSSDWN